jgi:general secretion pathway protein J
MKLRSETGFTLIEMVVAVALMSLMALVMFESLRFAQRIYGKISKVEVSLGELSSSQRVLRTLIESAYPYSNDTGAGAPRHLEGGRNEIAFSAPATMGTGAAGFNRYAIVLRRNSATLTSDVIVRRWVDRNGRPVANEAAIVEESLVADVASLDFSYLAPPVPGQVSGQVFGASGSNRGQTWLDEWREHDRLPAAVRVRIKYASKDSRNVTEARTTEWPEMVIVPRITDDANCEFDVVAQNCRAGS